MEVRIKLSSAKSILLFFCMGLFSLSVNAVDTTGDVENIKSYPSLDTTLVTIVDGPETIAVPGCTKYWLDGGELGSDSALSLLLSAKATNSKVTLGILAANEWNGDSTICQIFTVSYY